MSTSESDNEQSGRNRQFATTHWSIVVAAGGGEDAQTALAQLCEAYWYPLYAYVRRRGHAAQDAQDLTQAFFARLLEKQVLRIADPQRGKFRSFLLSSLDNFLANEHDRTQAKKRGGGRLQLPLDLAAGESRVSLEPAHELTPQKLYEREWALTLLDLVTSKLKTDFREAGKESYFELLKGALSGGTDRLPYTEIAAQLEISVESARQAAHRLRKNYRKLLREEVARTIVDPRNVDEELANLFEALGS